MKGFAPYPSVQVLFERLEERATTLLTASMLTLLVLFRWLLAGAMWASWDWSWWETMLLGEFSDFIRISATATINCVQLLL
jgi:hypothetical protein